MRLSCRRRHTEDFWKGRWLARYFTPMIEELTLIWLSGASLQAHQGDLRAWSRAHQVSLRPAVSMESASYDSTVAEAIEVQLDRGRTALAMRQADTPTLEQACQQILEHPELPQAAWLLAECHRLNALISAQGGDAVTAAQRQQAANALEGTRVPVYSASPLTLAPLEPLAVVEVESVGPRASDQIFLDGELTGSRMLTTVGTHHVRVVRDDSVLWSGWLAVAAQGGQLAVPLVVPACSTQELSGITIAGSQVTVHPDVKCANWMIAQPQADGTGIDVWQCQAARCAGPQPWPTPVRHVDEPQAGAAWYVWPLVGVGVALGTAAVLWQTGAFDRDAKQPERPFTFTFDEADPAAIRF